MWSLAGLAVRMTAIYFGQAVFVVTLKTTTVPLMMVFCLETVDMLAAPSLPNDSLQQSKECCTHQDKSGNRENFWQVEEVISCFTL